VSSSHGRSLHRREVSHTRRKSLQCRAMIFWLPFLQVFDFTTNTNSPTGRHSRFIIIYQYVNALSHQNSHPRVGVGPDPKGTLILEASGRYAQVQVRPDRPRFKAGNRSDGTAEENEAAVRGAYASFGTWSINEMEKTFTRSIIGSATFPSEERKDTIWSIVLTGDELKLFVPASSAGGSTQLLLQRAR
jgi:Lipocalin-like domain